MKWLLTIYGALLHLYPKDFHKAYADQMLLTAEDSLQEAHTRSAVAKTAAKLAVDLLITSIKENSQRAGVKLMKQAKNIRRKSGRSQLILSLQVVGMTIFTYVWLAYALINFNALRRINTESFFGGYFWTWGSELIAALVPLLFTPLAYIVLRKAAALSPWQKITWSYGIGFWLRQVTFSLPTQPTLSVFATLCSSMTLNGCLGYCA